MCLTVHQGDSEILWIRLGFLTYNDKVVAIVENSTACKGKKSFKVCERKKENCLTNWRRKLNISEKKKKTKEQSHVLKIFTIQVFPTGFKSENF